VDEFQDISSLDCELIKLVAGTGDGLTGRLFVVGDDKQSIYRFRGAEVTVFAETAERAGTGGGVVNLETSFRSTTPLVEFANRLFGGLMGRQQPPASYQCRYFDLDAYRSAAADGPVVEFALAGPAPAEDDKLGAEEGREREAALIVRRILEMVEGGEKIVAEGDGALRPPRFREVAVLMPAMQSVVEIYEAAFRDAGVPYYVEAGSGFYARSEIRDVVSLLAALGNPDDDVSLAAALRSPLFALSDETLFWLTRNERLSRSFHSTEVPPKLDDDSAGRLARAREAVGRLGLLRDRVPLDELVRRAYTETGYDVLLQALDMGEARLANLEKLAESARSFAAKGLFTFADFVEYARSFVEEEAREGPAPAYGEESDVVRIMTIHKAKGLEFPVVFLADSSRDATRGGGRSLPVAWAPGVGLAPKLKDPERRLADTPASIVAKADGRSRDEAESLRRLYVALTRAKDYLVVSGTRGGKNARTWLSEIECALGADFGREGLVAVDGLDRPVKVTLALGPPGPRKGAGRSLGTGLVRLAKAARKTAQEPRAEPPAMVRPLRLDTSRKRRFTVTELVAYGLDPGTYYERYVLGRPELLSMDPGSDETEDVFGGEERSDGAALGELVHSSLVAIEHAGDGPLVVAPEADPETRVKAEALIRRYLNHPLSAGASRAEFVGSEWRFTIPLGDALIEGAIDKLWRSADGRWTLVDFKTDARPPSPTSRWAKRYREQMLAYSLAVLKLAGAPPASATLAYLAADDTCEMSPSEAELCKFEETLAARIEAIRAGRFGTAKQRNVP
jgi:ATP-dependent helicase/nuclease subunit A